MAEATFRKSTAREYFESIVVAVILALFVRTFVFQAFKIPTGSMKPNLLVGDHLLVNKFIFSPAATALERALLPMREIRRGDTIELKNQTVLINGQPIAEAYAHYLLPPADDTQTDGFDLRRKYGPVTVPAGHYFMMGDNRDDSQDSRYWGFLPASYVKGRALFIYWSFDVPDDGSGGGFAPRWRRLFHQIH